MRLENAVAADVLERILSAYGFTMQKELSDKLGIAKSNVASWLQRGQVPGNVLVQCSLDTGADIKWLVTGEFANANIFLSKQVERRPSLSGQSLIKKMLQSGGKPVLRRIMEAYSFKTQKELSEYLGISTGTISTWIRREFFPGDVVITCALDTSYSLEWLATGEEFESNAKLSDFAIPMKKLEGGILHDTGEWYSEIGFSAHSFIKPVIICCSFGSWIADFGALELCNGRWVIGIDDKFDIYDVVLIPGKKIKIYNKKSSFICDVNEVNLLGRVIITMDYNY